MCMGFKNQRRVFSPNHIQHWIITSKEFHSRCSKVSSIRTKGLCGMEIYNGILMRYVTASVPIWENRGCY
ncbi:uncharacterized protein DS421_2g33270 [Arachis hypogaea]|nr:uncharacterized protein DS421_2g33270 [Arachis hypogaea]